jgi:acetyl esterase
MRESIRAMAAMTEAGPEMAEITDLIAPGPSGEIPVRVFRARNDESLPLLVFLHGGGFVIGDIETHDAICRTVAKTADCVVLSVDYRLAPEHPYPSGVEDCYAATCWAVEVADTLGADPWRVSIGGDSAGGNLAAVVAQMIRDRGGPDLASQLLIYPIIDCDFETASYLDNARGYLLTRPLMQWFWAHYLEDDAQAEDAYACPSKAADLSGLAPAIVLTAEYDPLRDEGESYAAALAAAGVVTVHRRYDGVVHGFFAMTAILDAAGDAVQYAADQLRVSWDRHRHNREKLAR